MVIIQLQNIRKSYFMGKQELEVLKGIDLTINKNEIKPGTHFLSVLLYPDGW